MKMVGMKEDEVIESKFISKTIERSQEKREKQNFDIRKHLLEYDDVLNQQRTVIYGFRLSVLEGEDEIFGIVQDLISDCVKLIISSHTIKRAIDKKVYTEIITAISRLTGIKEEELSQKQFNATNSETLTKDLIDFLLLRYELYTHRTEPKDKSKEEKSKFVEMMAEAQKWLMLESIDQAWKQHMLNLDSLKEGIGLRGWGQKNPLIEYKRESFILFEEMMKSVRFEIIHHIFRLDIQQFDKHALEARRMRELEALEMAGANDDNGGGEQQLSRAERRRMKRRKGR